MSPAQVAPNRAPPRFSEARGPPPLPVQGQGSFGAVTTVDPMRGQRRSVEVDTLAAAHVMGRGDTNCDVRMDLSEQVTIYGERDAPPARTLDDFAPSYRISGGARPPPSLPPLARAASGQFAAPPLPPPPLPPEERARKMSAAHQRLMSQFGNEAGRGPAPFSERGPFQ